jgi:hypothetical protein
MASGGWSGRNARHLGDDDFAPSILGFAPDPPVNKMRDVVDHDILTRSGIKPFLHATVR